MAFARTSEVQEADSLRSPGMTAESEPNCISSTHVLFKQGHSISYSTYYIALLCEENNTVFVLSLRRQATGLFGLEPIEIVDYVVLSHSISPISTSSWDTHSVFFAGSGAAPCFLAAAAAVFFFGAGSASIAFFSCSM